MAAGSLFIWIPVLFTCVVGYSERNGISVTGSVGTDNPDLAKILSKIIIPDGIDASHINVTSIVIKTCQGMKEALAESQRHLQLTALRYNQLADESLGLRNEARQLKAQLATCMSTAMSIAGTYPILQLKLNQMLERLDPDTRLIFKIMVLTRETSTLEKKVELAVNSNRTAAEIIELQRQLKEKKAELNDNIDQANESFSSGTFILQIISLLSQISDIQEAESGGENAGSHTSDNRIQVIQYQLTRKITQLRNNGDNNFANLLELISVRTKIAELKRTITELTEKSKTLVNDAKTRLSQKSELLSKKILELSEDEYNKQLTKEIMTLQAEVQYLEELLINGQNIANVKIQELRAILEQQKQRQDVIQRELEAEEYPKALLINQIISVMEELTKQRLTGQPTTVPQAKEKEYAKALAKIRELERKLRLLTEMGSKFVEAYEQVKTDFDLKIAELNRTKDVQAALVLKLLNLHDELNTLREQIALSEDQDLISELRRQLEKKQEELNSRIVHIERLTSSPGTILKIIELQYELWKLRNNAANGTRSYREEELQDRLEDFINKINNRAGENTKLILKIVTLQSQVEHLETLLATTYNSTSPDKLLIRDELIDELTLKKAELQRYISKLNYKDPSNARLILATTDLYKNLKRIEKENRDNGTSSLTLTLLQIYLQNKNREYAIIKDKVKELEKELQLKTKECAALKKDRDQLKQEVEQKVAELSKTKDAETALMLNVINLHTEQRALRKQISEAEDPEIISGLQRQLEEKQEELEAKTAELKRLIANPAIILEIIKLQDQIWELQNTDTNGTAGNLIREQQNRMDRLISQIDSRDQENIKLTLKIMNLQSEVKRLQNLLSNRETLQTGELRELTSELAAKKAELGKQVTDLKEKNQENARLILEIIDLQTQLTNLEKVQTGQKQEISELKNQLQTKEEQHIRDQATIQALEQKLNETEDQCSANERKVVELRENLTTKIEELKSKSDFVTSLALQISTLTQELEQLKTQLRNSVSKSMFDEFQKAIDKKNEELDKLRKELKNRSSQPQRLLQIIELQTQIEKLVALAQNDTDFDKIAALQERLNNLIKGIRDEENENTKLIFQILNQRDEIARLRKLEERKNQTHAAKIKDLEDRLAIIRNQLNEKTALLDRCPVRIANLSAQVTELEMTKDELEDELSALREAHSQSLTDLQRKLNLKERQLEDTESQLQQANSETFENVMEIADLKAKLKQAETQTVKTDKKIKELEKKLQTQQRETNKLEATNEELEKELQLKTKECAALKKDRDQLKQEVEQKVAELSKTKDAETALMLNVINLHTEQRALRKQISEAEDPEIISGLQRQLEEKQEELEAKTAELKRLIANPAIILEIIKLQDQIWELQNTDTNGTAGNLIREQQNRMDRLISQIDSRDQENIKLTLKIMNLQSEVKRLQNLLSNRETLQTGELRELTSELAAKKAELGKQVTDLKEKNQENARLILEIIDLQTQLTNLEDVKTAQDRETAAKMSELKNQLQTKEEQHIRDQATIQDLLLKLNKTEDQCSDNERKVVELQQNLTSKIEELKSKSDSVTSVALQISALTQELEQLKTQLRNSVSKSMFDELQKAIDKKNEELDKLRKELKNRSSQPEKLLQIIELQTEIEKLVNLAQNDTDFDKTAALQEKLNNLIKGIKDEENENTKLIFQILNQRDEIARLRKLEERKNQTHAAKIKDLEDRLAIIRNQIKEKTALLDRCPIRIANLSAQIMELKTTKEELEDELSAFKGAHSQSLTDLQRKLNLKERQLEDTESQLQQANSETFEHVMEIADLKAKLKQAETQTVKTDKKIKELEKKLQTQQRETNKLEATNEELEKELQLKTKECAALKKDRDQVKQEVEQKVAELSKTKDAETALMLNVINLHTEQRALRKQISEAEDPEIISGLQRQLEEKQEELEAKTAELKRLIANPAIILEIIKLQDQIWELQNTDTNGTAGNLIREQQNRMDRLISQIDSRDQENIKLTLKIMNLQSEVKRLQNLLSNRETLQTGELRELTSELAAKKAELGKQVTDLKEKNQENARLILEIIDLQTQLTNLEDVKTAQDRETAAKMSELKNQLQTKEEQHIRDQATIQDLLLKLNKTEDQCSDNERKVVELQQNLTSKIEELKSKSDSVTSVALQISALTQELEQLKTQLRNSVSKSMFDELQKAIDKKNEELDKLRKELKNRSSQPEKFLQIIELQTEIEKLVNLAQNDTDFDKTAALQEKLNNLIKGIKDEENENTKLIFQILNQRDEIARLRKLEERKNQTHAAKIKDLEDRLAIIRNQIKEKTARLTGCGVKISNLTAQIMELHMKLGPLESELSALREAHSQSLTDLQRKLNLKERQLEDTESQLQQANSETFENVMEIADLKAKLKQAETQTVKTDKKIKELEKKLQTQERETKKLEAANEDLKQEVTQLNACCSQVTENCEDLKRELQQRQEDVARLQQQLRQKDARLNNLEQDLQRRIKENNQLQDNVNSLQLEKNKLGEKVEELERILVNVEEETIRTSRMTFDPDTAHPRILLSADKTEMSTAKFPQNLPDNPERFDVILGVLGTTGFSSGRHYWEISVSGKTCYHLGMTSESSQRKGSPRFKPADGYWTIVLDKQGHYKAIGSRIVNIPLQTQPATLGILLDYKKGIISFYDSEARSHMYSFVGQNFAGRIYPFVNFCIEEGEAPSPMVLINPGATDWIK